MNPRSSTMTTLLSVVLLVQLHCTPTPPISDEEVPLIIAGDLMFIEIEGLTSERRLSVLIDDFPVDSLAQEDRVAFRLVSFDPFLPKGHGVLTVLDSDTQETLVATPVFLVVPAMGFATRQEDAPTLPIDPEETVPPVSVAFMEVVSVKVEDVAEEDSIQVFVGRVSVQSINVPEHTSDRGDEIPGRVVFSIPLVPEGVNVVRVLDEATGQVLVETTVDVLPYLDSAKELGFYGYR